MLPLLHSHYQERAKVKCQILISLPRLHRLVYARAHTVTKCTLQTMNLANHLQVHPTLSRITLQCNTMLENSQYTYLTVLPRIHSDQCLGIVESCVGGFTFFYRLSTEHVQIVGNWRRARPQESCCAVPNNKFNPIVHLQQTGSGYKEPIIKDYRVRRYLVPCEITKRIVQGNTWNRRNKELGQ